MEIIKYDDFEAYCNCYEYNGIYEIRFLIAQVKKYWKESKKSGLKLSLFNNSQLGRSNPRKMSKAASNSVFS